jgi:hypothetical protein
MSRPDSQLWQGATAEEWASLLSSDVFTPCDMQDVPAGVKPIPTRWVFDIKTTQHGTIERYKARVVVKGYFQRSGIDYDEVFAPTARQASLRALLAVVAAQDLHLRQLDVKTAFLNGDIDTEVYVLPPPGYSDKPGRVFRLNKALYGLKQAGRQWSIKLGAELARLGFSPSGADPSLYIRRGADGSIVYMLVHVDDILVAASDFSVMQQVISQLGSVFTLRDLGDASYYLGMEIVRNRQARTVKLSQQRYVLDLVQRFGLDSTPPKDVPMTTSARLTRAGPDTQLTVHPYSELVGALLYLSTSTRPDISFAVGVLTRFMANPLDAHYAAAKHVLKYVKGTASMGLVYGARGGLSGFCDSDYASDVDTRRSTSAYAFTLGGAAIAWSSKLQQTVATSTCEAEYMAAGAATREALWLRSLLHDLGVPVATVPVGCDNQGAIALVRNPITSPRSKHIDVTHHFVRERVVRQEVSFHYVDTRANVADVLTKALPRDQFVACRTGLGLR